MSTAEKNDGRIYPFPKETITCKLMVDGTTNLNGRVIPESVRKAAFDKYQERIDSNQAYGELGQSLNTVVDIRKSSHLIKSIKEDDDRITAEIKLLATIHGKVVRDLIDTKKLKPELKMRGIGKINQDHTISNLSIISFDFVPKEATDGNSEIGLE